MTAKWRGRKGVWVAVGAVTRRANAQLWLRLGGELPRAARRSADGKATAAIAQRQLPNLSSTKKRNSLRKLFFFRSMGLFCNGKVARNQKCKERAKLKNKKQQMGFAADEGKLIFFLFLDGWEERSPQGLVFLLSLSSIRQHRKKSNPQSLTKRRFAVENESFLEPLRQKAISS